MTAPTPADDEQATSYAAPPLDLSRLREVVHNVVSEDPVARAIRTGDSVETHREAWRLLTYLPGIIDELLTLRAGVSPQPEITRDLIRLALIGDQVCQCGYVAGDDLEPAQRLSALGRHMIEQEHSTAKVAVWALLADGATPASPEATDGE